MATTAPPVSRELLTPAQVADRLGVSPDAIYHWIKRGTIHPSYVAAEGNGAGKRYRIRSAAIDTLRKAI